MNVHAICECGHELHRHNIFPDTVCEGTPDFPEIRGKCDCKGFYPGEKCEMCGGLPERCECSNVGMYI